jgi:hypothetical protein
VYVPDDYSSIQSALNASLDGDSVIVRPGTYYENIVFPGRDIILKSEVTPDVTIIDGSQWTQYYYRSVILFADNQDTDAVVEGFTIRGGEGTDY